MYLISWFLFMLLGTNMALGGVGSVDNREYVDWSKPPYDKIVYFRRTPYSTCTAQYVATDIIATARHCVVKTNEFDNYEKIGTEYEIELHDGRKTKVVLETYGRNFLDEDWALLRIQDPNFFSTSYFSPPNKTPKLHKGDTVDLLVSKFGRPLYVTNAGFGYMRILSDSDIQKLKQIFTDVSTSSKQKLSFKEILDSVYYDMEKYGIESLTDYDWDRWDFDNPTPDYATLKYRLKADPKCYLVQDANPTNHNLYTSCDTWQGNSGGAYFADDTIYGVCSRGADGWENHQNTNTATSFKSFRDTLHEMRKQSATLTYFTPSFTNQSYDKGKSDDINDSSDDTQDIMILRENIADLEERMATLEPALAEQLPQVAQMSDKDFLRFLDKTTEYDVLRQNYEQARKREQSLANRMLGAAAMGMGGIGGMMLASGLAEQSADKDAELDMTAYLATFTCDYGTGRNIKGGTSGVELPGANELIPLYSEYVTLANDLKMRKAQLGLAPGIESETILNSATTGLYDDVSTGITDGTYASLARALSDPTGTDAKKWAEQTTANQQKITTGVTIGSTGIIGGAIGNIAINHNSDQSAATQTPTISPKSVQ